MTNQHLYKILDLCSYIVLLAAVVAVPLFGDKNLINFYIIPKQYVFIGLVLVSFLLFSVRMVLSKKIQFRHSVLDFPVLALLLAALISSILSVNSADSFFGRNEYFVLNFIFLLFLGMFFFLIVNYVNTPHRWSLLLDALLFTGGATAVLFVLKMIFKVDLLNYVLPGAFNSVDKLNSLFGVWMVVMMLVAGGQIIRKSLPVGRSLAYFFVVLLGFVSLVLLSFNILWWILLGGLVLVLLLGVSFIKEARLGWLSVIFASLVLVAVFIFFGTPRALQSIVPAEVALGVNPSWSTVSGTLLSGVKNFIVGSGLGTFGVDFSKFRPESFNYDNAAWSLRFGQPFCSLFAILAEGGAVTALIFLVIFFLVMGHILHVWRKMRSEGHLQNLVTRYGMEIPDMRVDMFLAVIAWVVLTVSMGFVFFSPVLWILWWLLLGMVISGLAFVDSDVIRVKTWAVEDTPQYSLSFSFVLIVIIAAVVMFGMWGAKLYIAEYSYAQALRATNTQTATEQLQNALSQRNNSDSYHAALAQVYLLEAANKSREAEPDMQAVSGLVALAVNEAKAAADISPKSVALWENLSTMYENAALLVPEAREWALKSLVQAKELEPSNPVLSWRLGNSYGLAGNWEEAVKNYEEAIKLKNDYVGAYVGLAAAYEQNNKIDEAIDTYTRILPAATGNAEALFNMGRLLFNRNKKEDRNDAEKLWLESVRLQPNYSNALYSLGLLYEAKGNNVSALRYFYKVKDLNPDNKDVTAKINRLVE